MPWLGYVLGQGVVKCKNTLSGRAVCSRSVSHDTRAIPRRVTHSPKRKVRVLDEDERAGAERCFVNITQC